MHTCWFQLVRYYSKCGLSKPEDKIPAILSLSLELGSILGSPILECHWFDDTPFVLMGLLWHEAKGYHLRRPSFSRAPSWSWASLDGEIAFADVELVWCPDLWHPYRTDLRLLKVTEHRPPDQSPCTALLLSGVKLECFARKSCIKAKSRDPSTDEAHASSCSTQQHLTAVYTMEGEVLDGKLHYDLAEDRPCQFWLIPFYVRWKDANAPAPIYYCLIVKRAANHPFRNRVFQRVGMGFISHPKWFEHLDTEFMVLI